MIQHLHPYDILATGNVTRWHTLRTARPQSLADHKARVALLAVWLGHRLPLGRFGASDELEVLQACLLHDMPETQLGDMPNPAKQTLNDWLGEIPGEPDSQDFDVQMEARFWGARGVESPMRHFGNQTKRLLRVADVLEAAAFYWTEGLTLHRPGGGNIPSSIVREAMAATQRELPELLLAVGEVLMAAGVPPQFVEDLEKELAA